MKLKTFLMLVIAWPLVIFAQQNGEQQSIDEGVAAEQEEVEVSGTVIDEIDRGPMQGAHVSLTHYRDTTNVYHAVSDSDGEFSFKVKRGRYILRVTFVGYQSVLLAEPVMANEPENDVGVIPMQAGAMLDEIAVEAHRPGAILRGDTLAFQSGAYRLRPDATTEDLLRRLTGIRIEDGQIIAEGEEVEKVLVDGREFFGDDPSAAVRNIPAEVTDEIEVYSRQSDQAELTGFDDGEEIKTINIVTRLDQERSQQFGRAYSGYGGDNRYQAGITTNIFRGSSRFSILGMTNNINEQNFAREDIRNFIAGSMRGGRGRMHGGGPPGGMMMGGRSFGMGVQPGENTTHALGVNYSDVFDDERLQISTSYFFNISDNFTDQLTDREYIVDEYDNQIYLEDSESTRDNSNHRFNMRAEYDIDENNSIRFTPRFTIQNSSAFEETYAQNLMEQGAPLSMMETIYDSDHSGYNYSGRLIYRHRMNEEGRSISTNIRTNFNNNETLYYLDAMNEYFGGNGDDIPDETVISEFMDQQTDSETINRTISSNVRYTEPIGGNSLLQVTYDISHEDNETDRITRSMEEGTDSYEEIMPDLSSRLQSNYLTQRADLGYRFSGEDLNFTFEAGYQHAELRADQEYPYEHDVERNFSNFLPRAMLRYNIEEGKRLRLFYRTRTSAPSVTQLQEVVDNSNPTQLSSGNPDLDHSYTHFLMARYNSTDSERATNFVAHIFANISNNYIGNSTLIARQDTTLDMGTEGLELHRGSQFTQPVNLDNHYNLRSRVSYGFPISPIKSNLNINAGLSYMRAPSLINDRENIAHNYTISGGTSITSNISQNIDFTLSYYANYNIVENTIRPELDNDYYYHRSGAEVNLIFLENWVFRNDLSHRYYAGLGDDFNQDYFLWNVNLGRKFLDNNQGELTLGVFDLLGQNDNIVRNVSDTYIEDYRTNELTRYFMLTFTYRLRNFNLQEQQHMQGQPRMREHRRN